MAFYVVSHEVEDFDSWKNIYDAFEPTRSRFSIKEHYALQSVDDANTVVVIGEGSLENINNFLGSEELKNGMSKAGVMGPPTIFVGENTQG